MNFFALGQTNLNFRLEADRPPCGCITVYIWLLYLAHRNQTFTIASAPTVAGFVFMQRLRLFLGQCMTSRFSIPVEVSC